VSLRAYISERPILEDLGTPGRRLRRRQYQRYFVSALATAMGVHLGAMLAGWAVRAALARRPDEDATRQVKLVPYRELGAPPSVQATPTEPPKFAIAPPKFKAPPAGIPVPVPKEEAPVTTIASQQQLSFAGTEGDTGLGDTAVAGVPWGVEGGGGIVIEEALPSPDDFVPVEEQPVLVEMKPPDYPSLAREAGIEGQVIVRVLVGKDGKVKDAIIGKSVNPVLDEASLAAARRYVFKPAIQNKNPVAVWVAIPFRYSLQE
jgi:protein TonB